MLIILLPKVIDTIFLTYTLKGLDHSILIIVNMLRKYPREYSADPLIHPES